MALAAGVALGQFVACSGGSGSAGTVSCSSKGLCPNDTPTTASDISQCQSLVSNVKCGALFQSYFDCAYEQQKCAGDGTLDGTSTEAAIKSNCASQVTAYQACSGAASMTPTCGYAGTACCASGPACASGTCCDPATSQCLSPGAACMAAGTVCSAGQCQACGAPGEPCCAYFEMPQANPCPAGGCCNYAQGQTGGECIAVGGQCDDPDSGSAETVCQAGSCITCGTSFGACCAGGKCTEANAACVSSSEMCMPCGGSGQPACP